MDQRNDGKKSLIKNTKATFGWLFFCELEIAMKKKFFIFLSTLLGLVCSYFYFSFYLNKDFTENGSAFDPVEGVS